MNKTISVERIFSLGDYQNIKFTDTISEIPDVIMTNTIGMKYIRYLQMVDIEWSYINYMKLRASEPKISSPEALEAASNFIEEERTRTFENLLTALQNDRAAKEPEKQLE